MSINKAGLSGNDLRAIELLLSRSSHDPPELEDVWHLVDSVWDEIGCENRTIDWRKVAEYYRHPVWILNGLFIEQHDISMQHRHAMSDWITTNKFEDILDYGGGFGTLARLIADKDDSIVIDIYEPHPSDFSLSRTIHYSNIHFVDSINKSYDCLIAVDVLEHLGDPLKTFSEMIAHVREGGYLLMANNFYPVIKCHLPTTFHLRYSFNIFAGFMGLAAVGKCEGSHATIYKKTKSFSIDWRKIRLLEHISKIIFPIISLPHYICSYIYGAVK